MTGLASRLRQLEQARGRRSAFVIEREGDGRNDADRHQAELEAQGLRVVRIVMSADDMRL
jgi:hypothetical protein